MLPILRDKETEVKGTFPWVPPLATAVRISAEWLAAKPRPSPGLCSPHQPRGAGPARRGGPASCDGRRAVWLPGLEAADPSSTRADSRPSQQPLVDTVTIWGGGRTLESTPRPASASLDLLGSQGCPVLSQITGHLACKRRCQVASQSPVCPGPAVSAPELPPGAPSQLRGRPARPCPSSRLVA